MQVKAVQMKTTCGNWNLESALISCITQSKSIIDVWHIPNYTNVLRMVKIKKKLLNNFWEIFQYYAIFPKKKKEQRKSIPSRSNWKVFCRRNTLCYSFSLPADKIFLKQCTRYDFWTSIIGFYHGARLVIS